MRAEIQMPSLMAYVDGDQICSGHEFECAKSIGGVRRPPEACNETEAERTI